MVRASLVGVAVSLACVGSQGQVPRDVRADTWVATDGLGRSLPTFEEAGPPRADRQVGMFYFLWMGAHVNGGPYDITKILAEDPTAASNPDSPLWGPLHAFHHWGESLFGYYQSDDPYVLRRHAQMLSDAGVDVVIFDVTNQSTYDKEWGALLRVWAEAREDGAQTPQIAFLCPFWAPSNVVQHLYHTLYEPGLHPELWYQWEGRPLILADPAYIGGDLGSQGHNTPTELEPGHPLGQSFTTDEPIRSVAINTPTWGAAGSGITVSVRREGPQGEVLASRRFEDVSDNGEFSVPPPSGEDAPPAAASGEETQAA